MTIRYLALTLALLLLCSGCTSHTAVSDPSQSPTAEVSDQAATDASAVDTSAVDSSAVDTSAPDVSATQADPTQPAAPTEPSEDASTPSHPEDTAPTGESDPADAPAPTEEATEQGSDPNADETDSADQTIHDATVQPDVPASQTPEARPTLADLDYSRPVPQTAAVDADYFADAAFVGDSRTEGFWLYSGIKQGKLLSATGLTVFSVGSKTAINSNQTVLQGLTANRYGKIYLSFGINELGYIDTDAFVQSYCQLIDTVRAAHPDAVIYIQNLIPVNDSKARASGLQGHVNCERVRLYNELIARIAQEKQVPLLDLYSAFAVDGQLPAQSSRDGVHLLPSACKQQLTYLQTHTVAPTPPVPVEPMPEPPVETEVTEI